MNIAKRDQRMTRLILFFLVLLTIVLLSLSSYVDTGAIPQPTATPQAVATPLYIHLEWGQEFYMLCSENSESQPAGQISQDLLGSEVVHGVCNAPGTVKGE